MPLIREDRWGLWAAVGGYVARPRGTTQLRIGDNPKGHHRGGSTQTVLKTRDGLVREIWTTTGIFSRDYLAGKVTIEELEASYSYYVLGSGDLSYWMNKKVQQQTATTEANMTFLQFNMKLNEIISAWLEDGGDPARCADSLRMAADEVFEDPSLTAERHEAAEHIALMKSAGLLPDGGDPAHDKPPAGWYAEIDGSGIWKAED